MSDASMAVRQEESGPPTVGKLKVVCFAGAGRSGSTLLARLLGEAPGFVNIGEATAFAINKKMMDRAIPCGCGAHLHECEFWGSIVKAVDGQARETAADIVRMRAFPKLLAPWKSRALRNTISRLADSVRGLLTAVSERTGCRIIVDSSKNPSAAYVLSEVPGIELFVVHLVRDPRGFVSSRAKPKSYLERLPPLKATGVWVARNMSAEFLRLRTASFVRVRYEDLARDPKRVLESLTRWIAGEPTELAFMSGNRAEIGIQHIIGGNPDKLTAGEVSIEARGWHLPRRLIVMVTSLTSPLLVRYGYMSGRQDRPR